MKKIIKMLIMVVVFSAFSFSCSAKEAEDYIEDFREAMPEEYGDKLKDGEDVLSLIGPDALISELLSVLSQRRGEIFSFLLIVLGSAVLLSLSSMIEGEMAAPIEAGVGAVCTILVFSKIGSIFSEVAEGISALSSVFSALMPVMTAITLAGGGGGTAAVQSSGMSLTLWLLGGAGSTFFISVVGLGLAMALITSFGDEGSLKITSGVKSFFIFCVGIISAVLSAVFALQTVVASAADSAAIRAARYAASGLIPVVGSSVSGALSTIVSGLTYAKSLVGAGGIAVIALMALSPLVMLLLYRAAIAVTLSFAEFLGRGSAMRMLTAFKYSFDSMIALYTVSTLVYIIEIVMFMKGGAAL